MNIQHYLKYKSLYETLLWSLFIVWQISANVYLYPNYLKMGVMVGTNEHTESQVKNWLSLTFDIIELNTAISELAVDIRKTKRIKLPDAIIFASAQHYGGLLVTRNTKDFDSDDPGIRIPYAL